MSGGIGLVFLCFKPFFTPNELRSCKISSELRKKKKNKQLKNILPAIFDANEAKEEEEKSAKPLLSGTNPKEDFFFYSHTQTFQISQGGGIWL